MVKGALAIARSSDRRVPLVRQRTRPGGRVVVGQHDSRPLAPPALGLHPHPRVRLQVADVISLRAVRGHQPEGATGQAVADRGAPADTGTAAGGLQQRESSWRETMQQQESPHPVAGPLNGGDRPVPAGAHSPCSTGSWPVRVPGRGCACVSGCLVGAARRNRTLMTSLEGVPHRAVTAPDLRIVVTGAASCWPALTLANGALMARRS